MVLLAAPALRAMAQTTLDAIRKRGAPICDASGELCGFSWNMQHGSRASFLDENLTLNINLRVGNYGERLDCNLGARSQLKLELGLSALWNKGGLI